MAFTNYTIPNIELAQLRTFYNKCDSITLQWNKEWEWLVEEYKKLQDEMATITNKLDKDDPNFKKSTRDNRTIKPIPNSVNHEYGWLADKEEFRLQKYGPDVYFPQMLQEYKIRPK